jgi:hypothetical protein
MRRYLFGELFVRFAKPISAIVLLGGVAAAGVRYARATMETAEVRYAGSASLGAKLFALGREWHRSRQLIGDFLGQSAPAMTEVNFANTPMVPAEFARVSAQLALMQRERDAAKEAIMRRFESQVMQIEGKLRAHASRLADAENPAPKPVPAKPPPRAEPAIAAESKTLFDSLSSQEVAGRRNVLSEGQDFIALLKSSAENPENAATLGGALDELTIFEKFFPPSLGVPRKPTPTPSEAPAPTAASRQKLNAERVADQLEQLRTQVRLALLKDWSIDDTLTQAITEVEAEQKLSLASSRALKTLWLNAGIFIALAVVCSMLAAFFTLVLADVARAAIDAASRVPGAAPASLEFASSEADDPCA